MKPNMLKTPNRVDRLATADEVRAAVLPFTDPVEECAAELLHEIAADLGGYVRISAVELETSLMVEELIRQDETWVN